MSLRDSFRYLNQYDMHKKIINEFVLQRPGDTTLLKRDTSKDKRDFDVIKENHKFLWSENDEALTWEEQFARKYYDRLFKEYCICDLSRYKENQVAMRWRIEKEVVIGKGQFICSNKHCSIEEGLRTWEVNFAYTEKDEKKNALVKIRLCPECSNKLNYHTKKKEVKRIKKRPKAKLRKTSKCDKEGQNVASTSFGETSFEVDKEDNDGDKNECDMSEDPWENVKPMESKSRDEEMEEYLEDLLL